MSTRLTKVQRQTAAMIQQIRAAPAVPTAWLPVSFVMAHVEIESGFDPAVHAADYAATGSIGLMQPAAATAEETLAKYAAAIAASRLAVDDDMTDPLSNLVVGMLYLTSCRDLLLPVFGRPLAYCHVAVGYNAGPGRAERMSLAQAMGFIYYIDWVSAQRNYAFLDQMPAMVPA